MFASATLLVAVWVRENDLAAALSITAEVTTLVGQSAGFPTPVVLAEG